MYMNVHLIVSLESGMHELGSFDLRRENVTLHLMSHEVFKWVVVCCHIYIYDYCNPVMLYVCDSYGPFVICFCI